jgi:hypothetical protein
MKPLPKDVDIVCPVCHKPPYLSKGGRVWFMECNGSERAAGRHHVGLYGSSARCRLIARWRAAFGKGKK